jgi:hypothetical protein
MRAEVFVRFGQPSRDKPKTRKPPTPREVAAGEATSPPLTGRVYGYCRVSTLQQAEEGESLEVPQRTIAGYAEMHGLAVERVFLERGVSGTKPLADRPQGVALLAAPGWTGSTCSAGSWRPASART